MIRYLLFFLFLAIFSYAKSQDIIVTVEQDTIDCKITRIGEEFIHFSVFDKSGVLLMKSRLPLNIIEYYRQAETDQEVLKKATEAIEENKVSLEYFDPALFRLALNTGYTHQLGGYGGLPNSYQRQVKSLWNFGGELHYFLTENVGVGAKVNHVRTKANEDFEPPFSTAFGFTSLRDELIKFTYVGVSVIYRNFFYDDQAVNYFVSGGIINYRTDFLGDGNAFYQEGDTFGVVLGMSYDFILTENFGLGFGAEINLARMSHLDNNGQTVFADFNLTRIDLTFGIRLLK